MSSFTVGLPGILLFCLGVMYGWAVLRDTASRKRPSPTLLAALPEAQPASQPVVFTMPPRGQSLQDVANLVCRMLPREWELTIHLERGAGTVHLYDLVADKEDDRYYADHETLEQAVLDALEYAQRTTAARQAAAQTATQPPGADHDTGHADPSLPRTGSVL